jgi:hypothetical protein
MMPKNITSLLAGLGEQINNALEDPSLKPFQEGILKILQSPWMLMIWKYGAPAYTSGVTKIYKKFGLPDFQDPISLVDNGLILHQFDEETGIYVLIPKHLQLGIVQNGQIDFKLQLIRSSQTQFPPQPHGCLDLRVEPHYPMEEALAKARAIQSQARLITPSFVWGYLHFQPQSPEVLPEKIKPMFLCWNGLSTGRIRTQLSKQTASFLKSTLKQGSILTLNIVAEVLVIGISPRLPVYVYLNPINLLRKLRNELMSTDGLLARQDVVNFFLRSKAEEMGLDKIEINGSYSLPSQNFAEAMADRVLIYFGSFVPSPTINFGPYVKLATPEEFETSQSTLDKIRVEWSKFWMLDVPIPVGRMYWIPLDMAEVGQQIEQAIKAGQEIVEEAIVPALLDGNVRVNIAFNLTAPPQGVDKLGVRLVASPDIDRDVPLLKTSDPEYIDLKFPSKQGDSYEYQYATYVRLSGQNQNLQADPQSHTVTVMDADFLHLGSNDFPGVLIPVEATKNLLEQATVEGTITWVKGQAPFSLSSSQPAITLAIPKDVKGSTLEIEVHSTTGVGISVIKTSLPAKGTQLTPYIFREFGPQKVQVNCNPSKDSVVIYEFLPEGDSSSQELWFMSGNTQKEFIYHSASLFQYRFRYRRQGQATWSDYVTPFQPLTITV